VEGDLETVRVRGDRLPGADGWLVASDVERARGAAKARAGEGAAVLIVGLMSGTSLDGIDAALVSIDGDRADDIRWKVIGSMVHSSLRPGAPRGDPRADPGRERGDRSATLHARWESGWRRRSYRVCAGPASGSPEVDVIGSHGQTVWHTRRCGGRRGSTLQLGDPRRSPSGPAYPVVSTSGPATWRRAAMARRSSPGWTRPSSPRARRCARAAEHRRDRERDLGAAARLGGEALAFDTGPGNALIDAAVEIGDGGRLTFDRTAARGARAGGRELLDELLGTPSSRRSRRSPRVGSCSVGPSSAARRGDPPRRATRTGWT
jgi:anhydro-N-acetylmuramic acid kinase